MAREGGQPWTFTQLTRDKKDLVLAGWSAPFGRPRQSPVVEDGVKVIQKTYRYPDSNTSVTRHVFNTEEMAWHLHGRFMDRELGTGGAFDKAQEVKLFVRDAVDVQISWGDLLSFNGFIEEFVPKREGPGDVAWEMTILIDDDLHRDDTVIVPIGQSPSDYADKILQDIGYLSIGIEPDTAPEMSKSLLEHLDDVVSAINGAVGQLVNFANDVDNFVRATISQVKNLQAGLLQVRTAVALFKSTVTHAIISLDQFGRDCKADIESFKYLNTSFLAIVKTEADMDRFQREIDLASRGRSLTSYVAILGDTWEIIAQKKYGDASLADALRQANGIRFGEKPQPGRVYTTPIA